MSKSLLLPPRIKVKTSQLQVRTEQPALEGDAQPPFRLLRPANHDLRQRRGSMRSTAYPLVGRLAKRSLSGMPSAIGAQSKAQQSAHVVRCPWFFDPELQFS